MATIKPIESRTVHQIQSGQVIVDLCSVVKELVENSVDAGATSIDVKFKNQGLDIIEIQDNGAGISPANYESVCLKHHTSKLSTYDDLTSLQTFGFRGEALASLCALSMVTITTCLSTDVPKGTSLSFDASGRLEGSSVVAAQKGTTVSVERLFHNLPVRRRELERNVKREWQKVIALLNQYACILTGLKFTVSQQPSKGKRIILFSTKGNANVRENIINIFSAKMATQLVPLDLRLEMKPTISGHALQASSHEEAQAPASREVQVLGHVSRPVHGEGRQTPDRQMFFVNGRPCGLPQFAKTFNAVYRSYNSNQSPFICADIRLDTDMYDVNVSPDKRSIMLHDQHHMLDTLRASLIALFNDHEYTVPLSSSSRAIPARPLPKPSQTSTFRFTKQDTSAGSPLSVGSESEDDEGDAVEQDDQLEESDREHRGPSLKRSKSLNRNARRIPSANSLSRGGPHSQSLLHHWVNTKEPEPTRSDRRNALRDRSGSPGRNTRPRDHDSDYVSVASEDDAKSSCDAKMAAHVEPLVMDATFSDSFTEPCGTGSGTGSGTAEIASAKQQTQMSASPIPSLEGARTASHSDDLAPVAPRISKRSAPQLTTVTIGNKTSTTLVGPPAKRYRSVTPHDQDSHQPSFGNRLSQINSAGDVKASCRDDRTLAEAFHTNAETPTNESLSEDDEDIAAVLGYINESGTRVSSSGRGDGIHDELSDASEDNKPSPSQREVAGEDAQPRAAAFEAARRRKDATTTLQQELKMSVNELRADIVQWRAGVFETPIADDTADNIEDISDPDAEVKLSLVISRGDFRRMRVAGQFNLGFIIAIRPTLSGSERRDAPRDDELFIIDQHASDEKYNFERLQTETVVQSQRLVQPKRLELTALEEEIVMQNLPAIEANGFKVDIDTSGESPVGARCRLLALPLSRETTFSLTDLEELISLLGDGSNESSHVPRPAKVRKMFAMRACRSSIMIGKALTHSQMYGLVKHMGEMDKPWNCPHGRPTMRHLCRLKAWDQKGWNDDVGVVSRASWANYMREQS